MDAAANPLPKDDTTPPVTKMNFVVTSRLPFCSTLPRSRARPPAHARPAPLGSPPPAHAIMAALGPPRAHERALVAPGLHHAVQSQPAQCRQAFPHLVSARHA